VLEENKELPIEREEYRNYELIGSSGSSTGDRLNIEFFNRRPW